MQLQSEFIDKFITAFISAQSKMKHAILDSKNPHFKSSYASLESVIEAIKGHLNQAGIAIHQSTMKVDGETMVMTQLTEKSGQWIRSFTPVMMDKATAQGQGSGITYARRYAIAAICCLGSDDDDGNMASGINAQTESEVKTKPTVSKQPQDSSAQQKLTTAGDFVIPFGKNKGKKLSDLRALQISILLEFVKFKADQKFRDSANAKQFIFWAEAFLKKNPVDDLDKALGENKPGQEDTAPPSEFFNEPAPDWDDYARPEPEFR